MLSIKWRTGWWDRGWQEESHSGVQTIVLFFFNPTYKFTVLTALGSASGQKHLPFLHKRLTIFRLTELWFFYAKRAFLLFLTLGFLSGLSDDLDNAGSLSHHS